MARKESLNKIMGKMKMEVGEEGLINYWKGFRLHCKGVGNCHKVFRSERGIGKAFSQEDTTKRREKLRLEPSKAKNGV